MNIDSRVRFFGVWKGDSLPDATINERFQWLIMHLASPYGYKGSQVCRWSILALNQNRFCIGDARHCGFDANGLADIVEQMLSEYRGFGSFDPSTSVPHTLTVLLPDQLKAQSIVSTLDTYRPSLTPQGLMLGALDPYNRLQSLTGGKGCPYSAPWNYLTLRWMVRGDHVFLNLNPQYKEIYIRIFGSWPDS